MFDEAKADLKEALTQKGTALTESEAIAAVGGGKLMAEQVLNQHAVTEEVDGTEYVVGITGESDRYETPQSNGQPVQEAENENETEESTEESDDDSTSTETVSLTSTGDAQEFFEVNGITIDVDPEQALAGQRTDDRIYGAPKLTNHHPAVPDTQVPYYPADLPGGERDTEDAFFRDIALGIPVILEGDHGSGKNQLVRSVASRLNLPMERQEFGADTSVMDVVGEKDLDGEDGTYYILGKAAKIAMFGGIYVADEINMAGGSVTSYLHPLFEDHGSRELELRGTGRTLRDLPDGVEWDPEKHVGKYIHPDAYFVGTCNPLDYADTNPMNDALRSRCHVIEHPHLAEDEDDDEGVEQEAKLVVDEVKADDRLMELADDFNDDGLVSRVKPLVRLAAVLREARREGNAIQTPIGHREIRDTVKLAGPSEEFQSFESAAKSKFVGQAALKQDKQYIEDTIEEEL